MISVQFWEAVYAVNCSYCGTKISDEVGISALDDLYHPVCAMAIDLIEQDEDGNLFPVYLVKDTE